MSKIIKNHSYHTEAPADDGQPITFRWHFPKGTLKPKMTGYEISKIVLKQMPAIIPFFADQPRVQKEFQAMYTMLNTKKAINKLLPWIKSVTNTKNDDIIELSLSK